MPVGRSTRVAVSSVTEERKTSETAAARPGAISGSVTRLKTASGGCPSERAASSSLRRGLGDARADRDQREREEEARVGGDEQQGGLVERERVADGEVRQRQRDDQARACARAM